MPFQDALERDLHFAKHGVEFGAIDAVEYERMADNFMFGAIALEVHECFRPGGSDRIRFGFLTYRLRVACISPQFIRTFHIVGVREIMKRHGIAGYFAWQCGGIFP